MRRHRAAPQAHEACGGAGEFSPIEQAEKVYGELYPAKHKPTLGHGGDSAFYAPRRHHVQMPKPETFVTNDDYYKTLFHELVHSTGHEDILNRLSKVAAFGSEDYSKEELVAEIGASSSSVSQASSRRMTTPTAKPTSTTG